MYSNHKCFSLSTEKVKGHFSCVLSGEVRRQVTEGAKAGFWIYCNLMTKINSAAETVGKDGKFQIFVCVGIRYIFLITLYIWYDTCKIIIIMWTEFSIVHTVLDGHGIWIMANYIVVLTFQCFYAPTTNWSDTIKFYPPYITFPCKQHNFLTNEKQFDKTLYTYI